MRRIITSVLCLIVATATIQVHASEKKKHKEKKDPKKAKRAASGYMGLMDANLSLGFLNTKQRIYTPKLSVTSPPASTEITTTKKSYVFFHFQESLLSNYFWANNQDKKVKFGFQETLDFGYARGSTVRTFTNYPDEIKTTKGDFVFTYQAGLAAVYKINLDMDAGFTFYPFAISYFPTKQVFCLFRFRYTNFMAELSAFGKKAIDIKYMKAIDGDRSTSLYFGLSYISNHKKEQFNTTHDGRFLHASIGIIL